MKNKSNKVFKVKNEKSRPDACVLIKLDIINRSINGLNIQKNLQKQRSILTSDLMFKYNRDLKRIYYFSKQILSNNC